MKKDVKFVLFDTFDDVSYEDYVENCEINGIEAQGENSDDYWEYVSETRRMWYEDAMYEIKHAKELDTPVLVTGTLGLWNGTPSIYPHRDNNVHDAIQHCWGRDIDDMKVTYENGIFYVEAYHHDGTNHFTIEKLSKKGQIATEDWYDGHKDCEVKKYWTSKFKYA